MNFSPDNRQTLQTLLTALGNGMNASDAMPFLSSTLQDQAQRQATRQQNIQGWAEGIMGYASAGMPEEQTTTMMDLLTPKPGVPGRAQGMIDTAYPSIEPGNQGYLENMLGNQTSPLAYNPQAEYDAALQQAQLISAQGSAAQYLDPAMAAQVFPGITAEQQTVESGDMLGDMASTISAALQQGQDPVAIHQSLSSDPRTAQAYAYNFAKLKQIFPQLALATMDAYGGVG